MSDSPDKALLVNYNWHHAVNDQSKLNKVLAFLHDNDGDDGNIGNMKGLIEAIEADIIYSDAKSQAVMGHPPLVDGNLSLASFLHQLQHVKFQHHHEPTRMPSTQVGFQIHRCSTILNHTCTELLVQSTI